MSRQILGLLGAFVVAGQAVAQAPGKVTLAGSLSVGVNSGTESYASGFPLGGRLAVLVGLSPKLSVETSVQQTWSGVHHGDDVVAGAGVPFANDGFTHVGGTVSAVWSPGGSLVTSGFRLLAGVGLYRVSAVDQDEPRMTKSAAHAGIESDIVSTRNVTAYLGLRAVLFPDLGGSAAVHVPLEIGIRIR